MSNSKFNLELYQEMLDDKGCQYDKDIQSEMFDNYMSDYLCSCCKC